MANTFFDAKSFNPEAFGKYMGAVPNTRLNELRKSRAIVADARLREVFSNQTGTSYARIPYKGLLGGSAQNYDGATTITTNTTDTFEQGVFVYGRSNAWTELDFSYDITGGTDFMGNIRSQLNKYWEGVDQDTQLSILKGIFAMPTSGSNAKAKSAKEFVEKHTYDITGATVNVVDATTANNAMQKACGDHKKAFSIALMHSTVATNLENQKLLEYLKYTDAEGIERPTGLATWNGKLVLVDDGMPTEEVEGVTSYTTYLLGEGAISWEEIGAKVPYEMVREAFTNGGQDTLVSRKRNAVSVKGISYEKASQASLSPTDAELENGANWAILYNEKGAIDHKTIAIARIISRG